MASLVFHYGSMNSGKSTNLAQAWYNYHERGMHALVLKPDIDDREPDASKKVISRIGASAPATPIKPLDNLFNVICTALNDHQYRCIFIDEGQFLSPMQVDQLAEVVDRLNLPVLVYGLKLDFQGELFPGSARLFALANRLEEIRTVCFCNKRATHVLRLDEQGKVVRSGNQIEIGGNDRYVSTCYKHWRDGIYK